MKPALKNETRNLRPASAISPLFKIRSTAIRFGLVCCVAAACTASAGVHRLNTDEMKMFKLASTHNDQQRGKMALDPILCKVARERAADMARRNYFSHVNPDGQGPNHLVRRAGYVLPSFYDNSRAANSIESIALTSGDSKAAFKLWMGSSAHKTHLLAEQAFYEEQTAVGVGVFRSPKPPYSRYYVFLSAPVNGSKLPPQIILKDPKGKTLAQTRALAADLIRPIVMAPME